MNEELKKQLVTLEAEFANLNEPLTTYRKHWEELRNQVRPLEEKMTEFEQTMDKIRHDSRYKELSEQLPALRKAVGQ